MPVLKRILPAATAALIGVAVLAAAFTSQPLLNEISAYLVGTTVIIAAFALFLGLANVLRVHGRKIQQRQPGSIYSVVLIAVLLLVLALGLPPYPWAPSGSSHPLVRWIFENVQAPIQASLSALLAFFVLRAAYRLLRMRNWESTVMLLVALVVLIGQVSVGLVPVLAGIKDWVLAVPAMAGVRGILLGVALGAVLTGLRVLLAAERPYGD
ncbi:hypothetical protein ACFLWA_12470 [Chloroflexota bacterium]